MITPNVLNAHDRFFFNSSHGMNPAPDALQTVTTDSSYTTALI
jgi:hypothetical protein